MAFSNRRITVLCLFLLLAIILTPLAGADPESPASPSYLGLWISSAGDELLLVEEGRMLREMEGETALVPIWDRRADAVLVMDGGLRWWPMEVEGDRLWVHRREGVGEYGRAPADVEAPVIGTFEIPPTRSELPEERLREIQEQLEARHEREQAALRAINWGDASYDGPSIEEVVGDNVPWLKETLREVGWIGADVFGSRTTVHAMMLVQHSGDLPLQLAALPLVEADFRGTENAQSYAVLRDRTQVRQGKPQRYGTQVTQDDAGPILLPLEDRARVDEFLAELGLPPLADYLGAIEKYSTDGVPVRFFEDHRVAEPAPLARPER